MGAKRSNVIQDDTSKVQSSKTLVQHKTTRRNASTTRRKVFFHEFILLLLTRIQVNQALKFIQNKEIETGYTQ